MHLRSLFSGVIAMVTAATAWGMTSPPTPNPDPNPDKAKRPPAIAKVVSKANRLLRKMEIDDEAVRDTIDESKVFADVITLKPTVTKVDSLADGTLTVIGTVKVSRGSADRYKGREERREIAGLNKEIREFRRDRSFQLDTFKTVNADWNKKGTPAYTRYYYLKQGLDRELDRLQGDLKEVNRTINARVDERRQFAEQVAVEIAIEGSLRQRLDVGKLMLAQRPEFTATFRTYRIGEDPPEIGGDLFIEFVDLVAVSVEEEFLTPSVAKSSTAGN
ncbi:MAG: hypothetical protein GY778_16175 [bacterium]|nr:hypothetical protein [bacterium]